MIYQNVWEATKAALKGKCIALNPYIGKMKDLKSDDLSFDLKKLKQSTLNPKASRRKGIIKIVTNINETENKIQMKPGVI